MTLIPGMEGWFNIWKSVNITDHINYLKKEMPCEYLNIHRKSDKIPFLFKIFFSTWWRAHMRNYIDTTSIYKSQCFYILSMSHQKLKLKNNILTMVPKLWNIWDTSDKQHARPVHWKSQTMLREILRGLNKRRNILCSWVGRHKIDISSSQIDV